MPQKSIYQAMAQKPYCEFEWRNACMHLDTLVQKEIRNLTYMASEAASSSVYLLSNRDHGNNNNLSSINFAASH